MKGPHLPMDKSSAAVKPVFTLPIRQITLTLIVIGLFVAGAWVAYPMVSGVFWANPMLNGFIGFVFVIGVLSCIWQVLQLGQSVSWIEAFVQGRADQGDAPRLLAPLAALLRARGAEMQISASSSRSILDSVATRIDEARDITRYIANLLIFLGLLGTFFGLATTVPAVVETIRALKPDESQSGLEVFDKLMSGLEAQLGGMGTAFSSSLLGLVGSLVVGLLELFASHGQNRFYRELEEWLSSFTRLGFAGADAEGAGEGDGGMVVQVLDHLTRQLDALQQMQAETDARRAVLDERIATMVLALGRLNDRMEAEAGAVPALERLAEGQERMIAALGGATLAEGTGGDAESRMRLRSIDVQLLRILEEISAGRQESMADLRGDLAALTTAVRQLTRATAGRGGA